jgi:hypothetical protein
MGALFYTRFARNLVLQCALSKKLNSIQQIVMLTLTRNIAAIRGRVVLEFAHGNILVECAKGHEIKTSHEEVSRGPLGCSECGTTPAAARAHENVSISELNARLNLEGPLTAYSITDGMAQISCGVHTFTADVNDVPGTCPECVADGGQSLTDLRQQLMRERGPTYLFNLPTPQQLEYQRTRGVVSADDPDIFGSSSIDMGSYGIFGFDQPPADGFDQRSATGGFDQYMDDDTTGFDFDMDYDDAEPM